MTNNNNIINTMFDQVKVENEKKNGNNLDTSSGDVKKVGEQFERLLSNKSAPNLITSVHHHHHHSHEAIKLNNRRRSDNSIFGSFNKTFRLSIGSKDSSNGTHVWNRYLIK